MSISIFDFAWLIGLLEGEGCFTLVGSSNNKQPRLVLQMIDKDIVLKANKLLGGNGSVGIRVRKAKYNTYGSKTIYICGIGSSLAVFWMLQILPYMSERRQEQIKYVLDVYNSKVRRRSDNKTKFPSLPLMTNV